MFYRYGLVLAAANAGASATTIGLMVETAMLAAETLLPAFQRACWAGAVRRMRCRVGHCGELRPRLDVSTPGSNGRTDGISTRFSAPRVGDAGLTGKMWIGHCLVRVAEGRAGARLRVHVDIGPAFPPTGCARRRGINDPLPAEARRVLMISTVKPTEMEAGAPHGWRGVGGGGTLSCRSRPVRPLPPSRPLSGAGHAGRSAHANTPACDRQGDLGHRRNEAARGGDLDTAEGLLNAHRPGSLSSRAQDADPTR